MAGEAGSKIIEATVKGERDPVKPGKLAGKSAKARFSFLSLFPGINAGANFTRPVIFSKKNVLRVKKSPTGRRISLHFRRLS